MLLWAALAAPGLLFTALAAVGPLAGITWVEPTVAFAAIVAMTGLCVLGSLVVVAVGWRHRLAEIAILGGALTVQSVLALVHGLTVPGVLYGANDATMVSIFVSVPAALVAALPLVLPPVPAFRAAARSWRTWTVTSVLVGAGIGCALLARPHAVPAPTPGAPLAVAVAALSLAGALVLSVRYLRLFLIGGLRASLWASVGFLYIGLSTLVWLGTSPFSVAWWGAHAADGAGVLMACAGLVLAHRRDRSIAPTLAPVVNRDPLVALELGLTPVVHRFMAALDQKDLVTRDHVVRVGELAMRVGLRAGLDPGRLRALGLAALLHDIGKLDAPIEILQKPGPLTDDEFERMKAHTVWGAEPMAGVPLLAPAAGFVRWHHERVDGGGYPDGLSGGLIPLEAGIVSVCDAWDAMTFTRPYRPGMAPQTALAILHEGAGSQWRADAVELLARELEHNGPVTVPVYDRVGRGETWPAGRDEPVTEVCLDALPDRVRPAVSTR